MQKNINEVINQVIVLLVSAFMLFILIKYIANCLRSRFAPVKTAKAQVIRKFRQELFSKYVGSGKRYRYVIVFSVEGKTLSFYVSEFSYGGYKLKEQGILKYKGNRLIDFG